MTFDRRHMNALAETIRAALAGKRSTLEVARKVFRADSVEVARCVAMVEGMETMAWEIAATLERSNPRFDRGKFASAAGLTV